MVNASRDANVFARCATSFAQRNAALLMPGVKTDLHKLLLASVIAFVLAPPSAVAQGIVASQLEYYHLDAIGSVRVVTNSAAAVVSRHDYLPFGEEWNPPAGDHGNRRFGGKERDTETGLDYFGARYYRSTDGRFTTIDPVYTWKENLLDPQRWNRYSYVRNNPFRFVDPDGRETLAREWQMQHGANGLLVLAPVFKEALNFLRDWNPSASSGSLTPEGQARWDAQYYKPETTAEAVVMGLTNVVATGLTLRGTKGVFSRTSASDTATLFRSVSEAEFKQLMATQKFAAGPGSIETGKWFWTSASDAKVWGAHPRINQSRVVSVTLPKDVVNQMGYWPRLDGIGPARFGDISTLNKSGAVIKEVK